MIQRIQSLYLLAVMSVLSILFFKPFASFQAGGLGPVTVQMSVMQLTVDNAAFPATDTPYVFTGLTILAAVVIFLSGFALLSYRNRQRQLRMVGIAFFANIVLIGALFWSVQSFQNTWSQTDNHVRVDYLWCIYTPLLAMLLLSMAMRAIRKDQALVRSADRLR